MARQGSGKKTAAILPRVLADLRMDRRQAEAEILRVWSHQLDPNIVAHAQVITTDMGVTVFGFVALYCCFKQWFSPRYLDGWRGERWV